MRERERERNRIGLFLVGMSIHTHTHTHTYTCGTLSCRPEALLFDCDGVLVDTEAEGHRPAFNEAFKRKGLEHEWSLEQYGVLLETGGGKERMNAYFSVRCCAAVNEIVLGWMRGVGYLVNVLEG